MKKTMLTGIIITGLFSHQLLSPAKVKASEVAETRQIALEAEIPKVNQYNGTLDLIKENKKNAEQLPEKGKTNIDEGTNKKDVTPNKQSEQEGKALKTEKARQMKVVEKQVSFDQIYKKLAILENEPPKVAHAKKSSQFGIMLAAVSGKLIYGEVV